MTWQRSSRAALANSNVGRGYHQLARVATDRHKEATAKVQQTINVEHIDNVAFTQNTTDSGNLLVETAARGSSPYPTMW